MFELIQKAILACKSIAHDAVVVFTPFMFVGIGVYKVSKAVFGFTVPVAYAAGIVDAQQVTTIGLLYAVAEMIYLSVHLRHDWQQVKYATRKIKALFRKRWLRIKQSLKRFKQ